MKITLMGELRSVEGPAIVSEESPVGARAANAMIEKNVWETHYVARFLDAYVEWCTILRLTLVVQFRPGL